METISDTGPATLHSEHCVAIPEHMGAQRRGEVLGRAQLALPEHTWQRIREHAGELSGVGKGRGRGCGSPLVMMIRDTELPKSIFNHRLMCVGTYELL